MNSQYEYFLIYDTGVINLELEKAISQDYGYSYFYARYVLRGRFKLGECGIVQNMHFNYYCNYLVKVMGYDHE